MAQFTTDRISNLYQQPAPQTGPPTPEPKRELLIFAIYIEMGTQSEAKAQSRLSQIHEMYGKIFKEIESQTNYLIKSFVFPIREGATRMECVFSGNNTLPGKANMEELFNTMEEEPKGFSVGKKSEHVDHDLTPGISEYMNTIKKVNKSSNDWVGSVANSLSKTGKLSSLYE